MDEKTDMAGRASFEQVIDEYAQEIILSEKIIEDTKTNSRHTSLIVGSWIGLSVILTFFNKYILTTLDFPYPIFLTAIHMMVISAGTRLFDNSKPPLTDAPHKEDLTWTIWSQTILPISILFSASLMLSNMAYVHLDVSIIQMIKALTPIVTLIIQLAVGLKEYNHVLLACILLPTMGGIVASQAQNTFSTFGLLCQLGAVFAEAGRMIVAQVTLANYSLTPSKCIKLYAPVCAVIISCMVPLTEGLAPLRELYKVGVLLLAANALVAWALNVASMNVIQTNGSLALSLFGYVKDVAIISLSVAFLGSKISALQWFGYALTLLGAGTYRVTGGEVTEIKMEVVCRPLVRAWNYIKESVDKWRGSGGTIYEPLPV